MSTSVELIRASTAADGSQGSADSDGTAGFGLSISADGGLVVFSSLASNLTVGDLNGKYDVFIKDLASGAIQIVSRSSAGAAANGASIYPDLTADGRYVVFSSQATNLVSSDTNGTTYDIFRKDLVTGEIVLADQSSAGAQPTSFTFSRDSAASSDGRYITFMSYSSLDPDRPGGPAVYLKDVQDGTLVNVSYGAGIASGQSISADGRYVAFVAGASFSTNLFVYDAQTGQLHQWTTSAASGSGNLSGAIEAVISANGRYVAFTSQLGSLVTGDTNGSIDVFRLDLQSGGIELVSAGLGNALGNGESSRPTISADGRYVAFTTWATNFASVDANGNSDVYVKDLLTGELTLLSRNAAGDAANDASFNPSISADGQHIAFTSRATNIVSGDTNGVLDVFVASLTPSNVAPVAAPDSVPAFEQNGRAPGPAVSGDVLENDTDSDVGDTISVVSLESLPTPIGIVGSATEGAYGSLTLNADGTFTYVLDQANATVDALGNGDVLSDVFTYTIRDSKGAEASSTLTVVIDGMNDSGSLPATADVIAAKGELVLLAELAEAAYHLRTDDAATLDMNEAELPEYFFPVDPGAAVSLASLTGLGLKMMDASDFGSAGTALEPQMSGDGQRVNGLHNGVYTSVNSAALIARTQDALFIAFRGTNEPADVDQDVPPQGFETHWAQLQSLRSAVTDYVNDTANEITKIYVTGHSLGAAMVQAMMREHAGDQRYTAATFGGPGYIVAADQPDSRIVNFANTGDPITFVQAANRSDGDNNAIRNGMPVGLSQHAMSLYAAEMRFLRGEGYDVAELNGASGGFDFDDIVFAAVQSGGGYGIGGGHDKLVGTNRSELMLGGEGDDTLGDETSRAATGSDRMMGGSGNDTYVVRTGDTQIVELTDGGDDHVRSSIGWTLGNNLEHLTLIGTTAANGTGNELANTITGNAAANSLDGVAGDDSLHGLSGNDTLNGGLGADQLFGGAGNDIYHVDDADDQVIEVSAKDGRDIVIAFLSWSLRIGDFLENLTLAAGSGNTDGSGNELANTITGNSGNNRLDGGAGSDRLVGGLGDDTYSVDVAGDRITETKDGGHDIVYSFAASYTIAANIEDLYLVDAAVGGTGNALANTIVGTSAGNFMKGGAGNDVIWGRGGADTLRGDAGDDRLILADASFLKANGGTGQDVLVIDGFDLDLTTMPNTSITGIETIELSGASSITLSLGIDDLRSASSTANAALKAGGFLGSLSPYSLVVQGRAGDTVVLAPGTGTFVGGLWQDAGVATIGGEAFEVFNFYKGTSLQGTIAVDASVGILR